MAAVMEFGHPRQGIPLIQPPNMQPVPADYSFLPQAEQMLARGSGTLWPISPSKLFNRPHPVLPDTDRERMLEVDDMALASFAPLKLSPSVSLSPPDCSPASSLEQQEVQESSPANGRRMTLPPIYFSGHKGTSDGLSGLATVSPVLMDRRHSAPSPRNVMVRRRSRDVGYAMSRRGSRESVPSSIRRHLGDDETAALVIPIRLSRPFNALRSVSGREIWWPVNRHGDIKVHVFIVAVWPAPSERLTRCFNFAQLQASMAPSSPASRNSRGRISYPTPGTVLPIPGDSPKPEAPLGNRFSTTVASCPFSNGSPIIACRAARNEFSAEVVGKGIAVDRLPILGAIMVQSKRPIRRDDKILLPIPFPKAWSETVEYIYTNNPELLSEAVKANITNLGGRV